MKMKNRKGRWKEKFEDIKGVIRSYKDRQYNVRLDTGWTQQLQGSKLVNGNLSRSPSI